MESMCRRHILGQRVGHSMVCCGVFQVLVLLVLLIPITFNVWQPSLWLRNVWDISQYVVGYTIPLSVILCVVCLINNEDMENGKKLLPSRFANIRNLFSLRYITLSCSFTLIGGCVFYLYAALIGGEYGKLVTECTGYRCLLESHMYLILCGFWIGQTFFLKNYVFDNQPVIHFVIQQSKVRQVKSELKPIFKQAFAETFWPTIFFALVYFWKGDSTRDTFCEMFYMKFEDVPISARFINVTLLIYSWFLGSLFFATLNTVKVILQVFMTEHVPFPISKSLGNPNCLTLHQALQMKTLPTIQRLGYHDLMILSTTDTKRREELFSLSQPGGHPHNWNEIIEDCLQMVNSFTAELSVDTTAPVVEPRTPAPKSPITYQLPAPQTPSNLQSINPIQTHFSPIQSPTGMRNLSVRPVGVAVAPRLSTAQPLAERFNRHIKALKENIVKRPLIAYMFGELPDSKVNYAFSRSQPVIWAAQSLGLLAAASYSEDLYGVAQKDLPAIITALLNLKHIIDKLQKNSIYKKIPRNEHHTIRLRHAIRSAVKRSLYRISVTFGNHLQELQMPKDVLSQVQNYILNREC